MKSEIQIGDAVNIFFDNEVLGDYIVTYIPDRFGDCWRFKDAYGRTQYVMNFRRIELKGDPPCQT